MPDRALHCANLCLSSYDEAAPEGFQDTGDLRYGITQHEGATLVTFRGTANIKNVLRDLRAWPLRTRRGFLAHKGFVKAFRILDDELQSLLTEGSVVFTGHSFGAAIALLFAEKYGTTAITFGCPRVYWRWGKRPDGVRHLRYACDDDPIPMVPRFLYAHLCEPRVLSDGDGRKIQISDHSMSVYVERLTG